MTFIEASLAQPTDKQGNPRLASNFARVSSDSWVLSRPSIFAYTALVAAAPLAPVLAVVLALNWIVGVILIASVAGFVLWRARRVRMSVTSANVQIDNFWRSYRFDWDKVDSVGMGSGLFPAVVFALKNGQRRRAQATGYTDALRVVGRSMARSTAPEGIRFVGTDW